MGNRGAPYGWTVSLLMESQAGRARRSSRLRAVSRSAQFVSIQIPIAHHTFCTVFGYWHEFVSSTRLPLLPSLRNKVVNAQCSPGMAVVNLALEVLSTLAQGGHTLCFLFDSDSLRSSISACNQAASLTFLPPQNPVLASSSFRIFFFSNSPPSLLFALSASFSGFPHSNCCSHLPNHNRSLSDSSNNSNPPLLCLYTTPTVTRPTQSCWFLRFHVEGRVVFLSLPLYWLYQFTSIPVASLS